jgi:arginyl-tRNA synthetase
MAIADTLRGAVLTALEGAGVEGPFDAVRVDRPARPEHGDWSTNAALVTAKRAGMPPRNLAEELRRRILDDPPAHVLELEIAGPGFVNFRLDKSWLHEVLAEVLTAGERDYARPNLGLGERVQVEFVSANPTGPIHVGNGWLGSYGDALARVLERTGSDVTREYYVNDTGGQILRLGESLLARRRGDPVPDQGYQGEYVTELASVYDGADDPETAGRFAAERILENIRTTLSRIGIRFDEWYSQASIEESGQVEETIGILRERGFVFEQDGAVWLRTTDFGDSRDRVLLRSDGNATYLAGDLAYHRDKFLVRKFDRVIDVFGADHHGQVASLHAGVEALGVDRERLEVELGQLVSLVRRSDENGTAGQRMSKRAGNVVNLDSLIDELGPDATRLLSLVSSIDQSTSLDLDLAREQSAENPVYYVQYAYARIAAIDRHRRDLGVEREPFQNADFSQLEHDRELELIRCLSELPEVVEEAAVDRAPYKVTNWVRQLAAHFHRFYHDCRVVGDDVEPSLTLARLWLVEGVRIGLSIGLGLLGVSAPEAM